MAVTEIGHVYQLRHRCQKYLGYFGIRDVIDTRDLCLSQPFLAILERIAYGHGYEWH